MGASVKKTWTTPLQLKVHGRRIESGHKGGFGCSRRAAEGMTAYPSVIRTAPLVLNGFLRLLFRQSAVLDDGVTLNAAKPYQRQIIALTGNRDAAVLALAALV